jgi:uncharacterized protein (DUF169 family)
MPASGRKGRGVFARVVYGKLQRTAEENTIPMVKCRPLCFVRLFSANTIAVGMDNRKIPIAG